VKRQRRLYLIFKMAIEGERLAQARHKEAQKVCDDPDLKEVLLDITKEEAAHEKTLLDWYARIKGEVGAAGTPA
jgi:rubrerythrin